MTAPCRTRANRLDPQLSRAQLRELGLSNEQVNALQEKTIGIYKLADDLRRMGCAVEVTLNISFPLETR